MGSLISHIPGRKIKNIVLLFHKDKFYILIKKFRGSRVFRLLSILVSIFKSVRYFFYELNTSLHLILRP